MAERPAVQCWTVICEDLSKRWKYKFDEMLDDGEVDDDAKEINQIRC